MPATTYSRDEIRARTRTIEVSLTSSAAKVWSSDVSAGVLRNIVAIILNGDGTASRTVTLVYSGGGTGARTATILGALPLGPTQTVQIPQGGWSSDEAIITQLVGGENISVNQSAGSGATLTIVYWDSDTT